MDGWREVMAKYGKSEGEERKKEGRKERRKENISTPMEKKNQ